MNGTYSETEWSQLRRSIVKDVRFDTNSYSIESRKRVSEMSGLKVKAVVKEIDGFKLITNPEHLAQFDKTLRESYEASAAKKFGIPYPDVLAEIAAGKTPLTAGQRLKSRFGFAVKAQNVQEIITGDPDDYRTPAGQAALKKKWNV